MLESLPSRTFQCSSPQSISLRYWMTVK